MKLTIQLTAHHPTCKRYSNHLIYIKGHPFCLGCFFMYSGMLAGLIIVNLISWKTITFPSLVGIHLLLLIPTAIQPWFQNKIFKVVSRFILGVATSSYFVSSFFYVQIPFTRWIFYLLVLVIFYPLLFLFLFLRKRFTENPCHTCSIADLQNCTRLN